MAPKKLYLPNEHFPSDTNVDFFGMFILGTGIPNIQSGLFKFAISKAYEIKSDGHGLDSTVIKSRILLQPRFSQMVVLKNDIS